MKLKLENVLLELVGGPGLRPQGPSTANMHLYPHHGLYSKTGGGKPKASNKAPYSDKDGDLKMGDLVADETPEEEEELPESIFKFTKSANDNTSFHRPPTYGAGAMGAYGKSSKEIDSYDPSDEDNEEKQKTLDGRAHQKVGIFEYRGSRESHPRDEIDYSTKQGWSNGLPGRDKKDIEHGEQKIDELMRDEYEDHDVDKIYSKLVEEAYADSSFNKVNMQKTAKSPKADLSFWNIIDRESIYLLTDPDKKDKNEKKKKASKDKKRI